MECQGATARVAGDNYVGRIDDNAVLRLHETAQMGSSPVVCFNAISKACDSVHLRSKAIIGNDDEEALLCEPLYLWLWDDLRAADHQTAAVVNKNLKMSVARLAHDLMMLTNRLW